MNKKDQPFLVQIAILTAITTFVWIGFSVYRALTDEPESTVSEDVLAPVEPVLNTSLLLNLNTRLYLNEEEIGDTVLINIPVSESENKNIFSEKEVGNETSATEENLEETENENINTEEIEESINE